MPTEPSTGLRPLHGAERLLAVAGFPVALVATHAFALALMRAGVNPAVATGPAIAAFYLALALAERWKPWHRSWLHSRGDLRTDVGLFATNTAVLAVLTPVVLAGATWLGAGLSARSARACGRPAGRSSPSSPSRSWWRSWSSTRSTAPSTRSRASGASTPPTTARRGSTG